MSESLAKYIFFLVFSTRIATSVCANINSTEDNIALKFATPCNTPNSDPGYCLQLEKCPVLHKLRDNPSGQEFIKLSYCGPKNEDPMNHKVCCGRYGYLTTPRPHLSEVAETSADINNNLRNPFPKQCGTQNLVLRSRIFGGEEATLGEFPWMARLMHRNKQGFKSMGCGGFLIHQKFVLTAAHCIKSTHNDIRGPIVSVILGEHNSETERDCTEDQSSCADKVQIVNVAEAISHQHYDQFSEDHHNDIGLIELKKGARLTNYVQPICLLDEPQTPPPPKYFISGWGRTEQNMSSSIKLKTELQPFNLQECKERYRGLGVTIKKSQICAGGFNGKDSCSGDSGGPLMMTPNGTVWYASGIVSYGLGCGREGWPGVYTNIPSYSNWIRMEINKRRSQQTTATKIRTRF